jgi:4-diphosphocytidyl-2-C-methyl-D-erythritol kinase
VRAPAKLNLSLAVGEREDDGYHRLDSLAVPLKLADELALSASPGGGIELSVTADPPGSSDLPRPSLPPTDRDNLVWRAAEMLAELADRPPDVRIALHKRIPTGGGLGGGSADAAATLWGLNRLWRLDLSTDKLMPLAAGLGSDVPFCLIGRAARIRGRGEIVRPLDHRLPSLWALLIFPGIELSTGQAYERLDQMREENKVPPRREHEMAGLRLFNDLEAASLALSPSLGQFFRRLSEPGQLPGVPRLMVAGSGSTLFSLFTDADEARVWEQRLKSRGGCSVLVTSVIDDSDVAGP